MAIPAPSIVPQCQHPYFRCSIPALVDFENWKHSISSKYLEYLAPLQKTTLICGRPVTVIKLDLLPDHLSTSYSAEVIENIY